MKTKNTRRILALFSAICLIFLSLGCSFSGLYSEGEGKLNVLCSTFVPFDVSRTIGGDRVKVTILQDSGADLHSYTPTTETLNAINNADIFIYIGGSSDALWVDDAISASSNDDLIAINLTEHTELIHAELSNDWSDHSHEHSDSHSHDHEHAHEGDEHIWTSIRNVGRIADEICDAFCAIDPDNGDFYRSNAAEYASKLEALDADFAELFESFSGSLIFADRFPFVYLMHDYHVPYIAAFSGCSTEVNSSFSMQVGLIKAVRSSGAGFVIVIEGNDKSLAEAISTETGCNIISLNSLQSVKRSEIQSGVTYIKAMEENLTVLKEAIE